MGSRIRGNNGWGRTPAATEGEDGSDVVKGMTWVGNGRFANCPYEGQVRVGEDGMATSFLDCAALRSE